MTIAVVGMGLIGGSLCRAFKQYTPHRVLGHTRNQKTVAFALSVDAIDGPLTDFSEPDVVFVALPPEATIRFLREHVQDWKPGAIVADICGVKQPIIDAVDQLYHDQGVRYVGTHPMAGKEVSGFANSDVDLYKNASYILTPTALTDPEALETLKELAAAIGFSRIEITDPARHDTIIAYTSQLAHVVSSAYIKSPTADLTLGFTAGSFQDMTRVAKLDPDMWTSLFSLNRGPLLQEINTLLSHLTLFRDLLAAGDQEAIRDQLDIGRQKREEVLLRQHQQKTGE
jgi:prephenate dehydrogenase